MGTLSENWLTEGLIDFEYKKYVLLGYLQKVKSILMNKNYILILLNSLLITKMVISIKNNTSSLESGFKKSIKGIRLRKTKFCI
jgi:hypothetical protein